MLKNNLPKEKNDLSKDKYTLPTDRRSTSRGNNNSAMLKNNLAMLRNLNRFSQEEIAERIGISRQAYAKWETGATVPDIEKCSRLAEIYGVTLDSLIHSEPAEAGGYAGIPARGKNIWGSVTMNDRGQVVIPKGARDKFGLKSGARLIVLSDDEGIALIEAEKFEEHMREMMELASKMYNDDKAI